MKITFFFFLEINTAIFSCFYNNSNALHFLTLKTNPARLDGISKPPRRPPTIEDFLQSDDQLLDERYAQSDGPPNAGGKKRVRWADIEEAKAQRRMRDMGFVVGVTDWNRMMDPTAGGSALTKTKYIERIGRNSFRRN